MTALLYLIYDLGNAAVELLNRVWLEAPWWLG